MANFQPFSYGQVIGQAENILASQQRRDPNSMQNQLLAAKIRESEAAAANPGGSLGMSPISGKDFTGESIKAAIENNDPGLLVPRPYTPKTVDTKTHRIFYDIDPTTREVTELHREPIQNFDAERDAALGQRSASQGGLPSNYTSPDLSITGGQGADLGGDNLPQAMQPVPSEAEQAGLKTTAQEQAKVDVERTSPASIKKQQMREADAVNAKVLIDDMLAPRKDGGGIYATYAYGKANVVAPDLMKPQEWIDAEAKRNQLVSMMQLENVAKLKGTGPITEPEQKVLRQAMTVLENPLISPKLVERELKRVRVMFARWEREAKAMQGKAGDDFSSMTDEELKAIAEGN